jgi:hypothetical protein
MNAALGVGSVAALGSFVATGDVSSAGTALALGVGSASALVTFSCVLYRAAPEVVRVRL